MTQRRSAAVHHRHAGMALIAVLWIVAALSVMVIGLSGSVRQQIRIAGAQRDQVSGQAVAEAAMALALQTMAASQERAAGVVNVQVSYGGQTIGVGAGQQSRLPCTRLAGEKADIWWLRRSHQVLSLPFLPEIKRPERDNLIDQYIGSRGGAACGEAGWEAYFSKKPVPMTEQEKRTHIQTLSGVSLGSDAFFPFDDNIERAHQSGVAYIAQPGGSVRDADVIACCNRYKIAMFFTGMRLFHH